MDYQYAFRQAHKDRLEDAGVVQYRSADGFCVFKPERAPRRALVPHIRPVLVSLINLLTK